MRRRRSITTRLVAWCGLVAVVNVVVLCPSSVTPFQASLPTSLTIQHHEGGGTCALPRNPLFASSSTAADSFGRADSSDETSTTGKVGQWEELNGNWILRPFKNKTKGSPNYAPDEDPPRALLHFLGGALVGAAPHITYRYLLESLAEKGFLIVATPYQLSFDHLATCDSVLTRFENMAPTIAKEYGALPVVGIGHSCGALLHLLITCLFPDTPRAANALISFNNKPVTEAVPFFEEVFAPFFTTIASSNGVFPSSSEAISLSLQVAKAATEGELPSDALIKDISNLLTPPGLPRPPTEQLQIPTELRKTMEQIIAPSVTALSEAGVLPVLNQAVVSLEQIPKLVDEVADGARDFVPTPSATRAAARKSYRARRTLILEYSDDIIDESDQIEELLKEAERLTRMKRPMVGVDVQRIKLEGGHASPLLAPPLDLAERVEDLLGSETSRQSLYYQQASATVDELVRWLEEGNL